MNATHRQGMESGAEEWGGRDGVCVVMTCVCGGGGAKACVAMAHLRRDPLLMLLGPGESGVGSGRLGVAGDGNDHRGIRCDVHLEAGGGAGSASQEREGGGGGNMLGD